MLTSFEEWKNNKLDELQMGGPDPINNRKIGQAFGGGTSVANPKFMSYLRPRIEGLWRLVVYKAEKENPGSSADPGRMRQLQDQFVKDLIVVVTKCVRGEDSGGGRSVNFYRGAMNQMPTASEPVSPTMNSRVINQGPQVN